MLALLAVAPMLAVLVLSWLAARSWIAFAWCTLPPLWALLFAVAISCLLTDAVVPGEDLMTDPLPWLLGLASAAFAGLAACAALLGGFARVAGRLRRSR